MRFVILVVGAVGAGALSAEGIQVMFPQTAQMFDAVRALGGDPSKIKITNINPVRAFEDVMSKIASGEIGAPIKFNSATPVISGRLDPNLLKTRNFSLDIDFKRAMAASIGAQISQQYNRSQALQAYGRNPAGWHGAPPF
jgi:hypothetical protein